MKTVEQLGDLTRAELGRIRNTLKRRFRASGQDGVLEVGFGRAERRGALDPRRPESVCFYVRRKRMPRSKQQRIPAVVEVRVRRGPHLVRVRLPTDVLAVDASSLRPTGRTIRSAASTRRATAGCVLGWRVPGQRQLEWGVLTVGHLFGRQRRAPGSKPRVWIDAGGNRELEGALLVRSARASQVDAAIVRVAKSELVRAGLIAADVSTRGKRVRSSRQLARDTGHNGLTLPGREQVPFMVLRYLPVTSLVAELGTLVDVLDVRSTRAGTFAPGRSGSLWLIERQAACQQFGGWETRGKRSANYRRGLGQSLVEILAWAAKALARTAGAQATHVDLRLIREL